MLQVFSPFRIILCFLAVASAAWLVLPGLKVNLLPEDKSSTLSISYSLPDASPDILEQQVTSTIEGACSQLSQLKKIRSSSRYNSGYVELAFDKTADMQMKHFEMAAIIRRVYHSLPPSVSYPVIEGGNNSNADQNPLLIFSINAPWQPYHLRQQAEEVFSKAFAGITQIKEVKVSGTEQQQLAIMFNKEKCLAYGINPASILALLQDRLQVSYPGNVSNESGNQLFLVLKGMDASVALIEDMQIPVKQGTVRLKDIATVFLEEQEPASFFRINGKNSVALSVFARNGENKIVAGKLAKQIVGAASKQLPAGYEVRLDYDDSEFLEKEIFKNYRRTSISITILLIFVLFAYRNWRYLLNLFAGLLVTVCLTLILAWLFKTGIHLYTVAGLAISFGIMIDNAIVILDYYHRFKSRKIFTALLAATLTTVAALSLVFFLPEEEQKNLADFSLIIILALVASLITALWFTPGLYQLTITRGKRIPVAVKQKRKIKKAIIKINRFWFSCTAFLARYRKTFICFVVLAFGLPVFLLPAHWEGEAWYNRWYNVTVGNEYYQENIRPYADKWLGGALRLFANNVYEKSGYRSPEKTKLYLNAELPYGNTPEQMNYILTDFENYLSGIKGVDKFITNVYSGQNGSIEISFKEGADNSSLPYQLKSRLIARSLDWGAFPGMYMALARVLATRVEVRYRLSGCR